MVLKLQRGANWHEQAGGGLVTGRTVGIRVEAGGDWATGRTVGERGGRE